MAVGQIDRTRSRPSERTEGGEIRAMESHRSAQPVESPTWVARIAWSNSLGKSKSGVKPEVSQGARHTGATIDSREDIPVQHAVAVSVLVERETHAAVGGGAKPDRHVGAETGSR